MAGIESGFQGERFAVVSQPFLELMKDNPLTGDLYLHSLGYIANALHHRVSRPGGMEQSLFIYCTGGRGKLSVGSETFSIGANQYIAVTAGIPHAYSADPDDPWTIYWILFAGSKAGIFASQMSRPVTVPPSVHSRIEERTALFESMYSVLCGELSLDKMNYANIVLAHFMASFIYTDLFDQTTVHNTYVKGAVSRATHFMSENIESCLTLKQIADYAGYSESYFYRKFIKETGFSPIDYFIHMKVNKAAVYLIKTPMTVVQISAKLGFNSPDYFSRTFRRIVGISATDFRKQNFRL